MDTAYQVKAVALILLLLLLLGVCGAQKLPFCRCSPRRFDVDAAVGQWVQYVLDDLLIKAVPGHEVWSVDPRVIPEFYGHAKCSESISRDGCSECLEKSRGIMERHCVRRYGANVNLENCMLQYDFVTT